MTAEPNRPRFNAIYFDTNILVGHRWPEPRPALQGLLRLARWWKVAIFFPEPTLTEAESHWLRKVEEAVGDLTGACRRLPRVAAPIPCEVTMKHPTASDLLNEFRVRTEAALKLFDVSRTGFTSRSSKEVFEYATRYVRPFSRNEEGKGFQDAVIFLSVLDHVRDHDDISGVLVSNDGDMKGLDYGAFAPGFDAARLRVLGFDAAFEELFRPYFDEAHSKPYRKLLEETQQFVESGLNDLRDFVASHLTTDMLRSQPFDTVRELLGIDRIDIRRIDLPLPDSPVVDGTTDIAIKVLITCKALVATDYAGLRMFFGEMNAPPQPPHEQERMLSGYGLIQASGQVVSGQLKQVNYVTLAKDEF